MLPQTQRVPWTSSVFTVLLCFEYLVLVNIQMVTAMSLDRLGLERQEIQQSSLDGLVIDDDRQLTPVLAPVNEVADMYMLSPAIDKNTIESDINVPNGETDMLMVESNAVPTIEKSTEVYMDTQNEEENRKNSEDIIENGSVSETNSQSLFENVVEKDITDKDKKEPITSLDQSPDITKVNIDESILNLKVNSEEQNNLTSDVNQTSINVNDKVDNILDTVVDVLDDAMKQFELSDFSNNQKSTEEVATIAKNENPIGSILDSKPSIDGNFQEIAGSAPSEIVLNEEEKKEEFIDDNGNDQILVFNENIENANEPAKSDDMSESEILNITENIENVDENSKNDFMTNPSEETNVEQTTEYVENFEDINIPENVEAQNQEEELFTQSLEHSENEEIVEKLDSPEIESGTIKTDLLNSEIQENLDNVKEETEIITEKNTEIESETEMPIATENPIYIEQVPEKIIINIDEIDTTIKPQILNDKTNEESIMQSASQFELSNEELVKPLPEMTVLEIEPLTSENSNNDKNQETFNVIDSVLNYVNASFVQHTNKQKPLEPLKDEEDNENDFKPTLRSYEGAQVWRIVVQSDKDRKLADELLTKYGKK